MKIETTIEIYCPSGFYCTRNGEKKCSRINFEGVRPYCEVFYPFLETDSHGNVLKTEQCLLAERNVRKEL